MEMILSLPGLSAAGAASFTFLRTVFAKHGVSNRDLRRALLPEMEVVKEGLEQLKQKDLATALLCLERALRLVPSTSDVVEKLETQRYLQLAEQHALMAFGAATNDTDVTVKIEAIRIGITSVVHRRGLKMMSDRHLRLLCMEWLELLLDMKMKDARSLIRESVSGHLTVAPSGGYFFSRPTSRIPSAKTVKQLTIVHDLAVLAVATLKFLHEIGTTMEMLQNMLSTLSIPLAIGTRKNQQPAVEFDSIQSVSTAETSKIDLAFVLLDLTDEMLDWEIPKSSQHRPLPSARVPPSSSASSSSPPVFPRRCACVEAPSLADDPYAFQRHLRSSTGGLVAFAARLTSLHANGHRERKRKTSRDIVDAVDSFKFFLGIAKRKLELTPPNGCVEQGEKIELIKTFSSSSSSSFSIASDDENSDCVLIRPVVVVGGGGGGDDDDNNNAEQHPPHYHGVGKGVLARLEDIELVGNATLDGRLRSDAEDEERRRRRLGRSPMTRIWRAITTRFGGAGADATRLLVTLVALFFWLGFFTSLLLTFVYYFHLRQEPTTNVRRDMTWAETAKKFLLENIFRWHA